MRTLVSVLCVSAALAAASPVWAQTYPANFTGTDFNQATGMTNPTAMEFAPDGRLFVCLQGGALRVFSSTGVSLGTFMTLTVDAPGGGERGMLGIAFDPSFASNHFLYIYRTVTGTPGQAGTHNIVSRFTEDTGTPNRVLGGSEVIILELDGLSGATNHNGGAIHFGSDGKLYVAVGENANSANAQVVTNRLGKILRINTDGSIPADNPTTLPTSGGNVTPTGLNRAIWAMGFRNPYTFAVQPGTGRILINDVGQSTKEEIDDLMKGANYGWPNNEGSLGTSNAAYTRQIAEYDHGGSPGGCAITGGTFYNPGTAMFPAMYVGNYFFQDYCGGWIRLLTLSGNTHAAFASGIPSPVDLKVDSAGALYCLAGANSASGKVIRITYSGGGADQPTVATFTTPGSGATVSGAAVAVNVTAHDANVGTNDGDGIDHVTFELLQGATVLTNPASHQENVAPYDWTFDSTVLSNGTYTIRATAVSTAAAGGTSVVITRNITVSNAGGNTAPVPTIVTPGAGTMYNAGQTISFSGTATDTQDGTLGASAFTWRVDFHHATHSHPFMANTSNILSGTFTIPNVGETASNVWYRIYLTVTDSGGLSTTITRDIMPNVANITLQTVPAGLQVTLDGIPQTSPLTVASVVGMQRGIGEVQGQTSGPDNYVFASWSDGGGATHTITSPGTNTTYTLTYAISAATIAAGCGATGLEVIVVLGVAALLRRRRR